MGSYQVAFIDGWSTTDQIFTVRQIFQKCRKYQVPTHHLFIDFKAAYDSIDHENHGLEQLSREAYQTDKSNDGRCAEQRKDFG